MLSPSSPIVRACFIFNVAATTAVYPLSLHDALPIRGGASWMTGSPRSSARQISPLLYSSPDRKSTRLNSSHLVISYAVFCLKKKNPEDEQRGYVASSARQRECLRGEVADDGPRNHRG